MTDDSSLLHAYLDGGSQPAFEQLVRRHVNLVYGAALRLSRGNTTIAEEVSQLVFIDLARKATQLKDRPTLVGWLHTSARFAAAKAMRSEGRRRAREHSAMLEFTSTAVEWVRLRPLIDDALLALDDEDREAVLLRCMEDYSFADVGAALRLSEDAARKRVTRALDRLASVLSRRGVTSTSSALGLALTQYGAASAPPALVGTIVSALVTVSATSTAGILSAAVLTKMSATATLGTLVLAGSLVANGWLALSSAPPRAAAAPVAATTPPAALHAGDFTGDIAAVRERLRQAGTTEEGIRATLEGLLRREYRRVLSTRHAELHRDRWWQVSDTTFGISGRAVPAEDPRLFRAMVTDRLKALLGPDPADLAEINARYGYLPPADRDAFAGLEDELRLLNSVRGQAETEGTREHLATEIRRIEAERERLVQALPPEQRAEYDLRHATFASRVMRRMELIEGNESEYRQVFAVVSAFNKELSQLPPRGESFTRRQQLEREAVQAIVAAIGFERACDYVWSGVWEYSAYARAAREAGLPRGTAGRVFQLAAETAERASLIHHDPSLDVETKHAALAALQQSVRPQFDRLMPPEVQARLAPEALEWVNALGAARYRMIATTVDGNPGSLLAMAAPGPIGTLPPGTIRRPQLLPQP